MERCSEAYRVYVAGKVTDHARIEGVYTTLEEHNVMITHKWTRTDAVQDPASKPRTWRERMSLWRTMHHGDMEVGIDTADAVLVLLEDEKYAYRGTLSECNRALGRGKRVFAVAPAIARGLRDNTVCADERNTCPVQYCSFWIADKNVLIYETLDEAVAAICGIADATAKASSMGDVGCENMVSFSNVFEGRDMTPESLDTAMDQIDTLTQNMQMLEDVFNLIRAAEKNALNTAVSKFTPTHAGMVTRSMARKASSASVDEIFDFKSMLESFQAMRPALQMLKTAQQIEDDINPGNTDEESAARMLQSEQLRADALNIIAATRTDIADLDGMD